MGRVSLSKSARGITVAPLPPTIHTTTRTMPAASLNSTLLQLGDRDVTRLDVDRVISASFERAAERLMAWELQRSVFRVRASEQRVSRGAIVEMGIGPSFLPPRFYCRVVDVIEEADRCGFTYATLPGHPEYGVESFLLQRNGLNGARLNISAVSRPSSRLWRRLGPLLERAQHIITTRFYLRALDD